MQGYETQIELEAKPNATGYITETTGGRHSRKFSILSVL